MKKVIAAGFGGMAGALLRAAIYGAVPGGIGLWIVNLLGSFLLGFAAMRLNRKPAELRLFISTGLLGSFTTFSAFSADWFYYIDSSLLLGLIFAVGMTLGAVAAAGAGVWLGRKGGAL